MSISPNAGKLPSPDRLVNVPALVASYYTERPDTSNPAQRVSFGTSGHRGSSLKDTFNEDHILAVTQAVCEIRKQNGVGGPLFMGMDTHALSEPAFRTALEVLTANDVTVGVQAGGGYTPTPVISHAILTWNRTHEGQGQADGIVITPSHNPPSDGGFKYNPPTGGPADTAITSRIERRANELLADNNRAVRRTAHPTACASDLVKPFDLLTAYVDDLEQVLDMRLIADSGLRLGADSLGGATLGYWEPIADKYGLNLTVVSAEADPTFRFIPQDHDGKTRMDCSSPYAMSKLLDIRGDFDLAFGCDPDADRHGIVTPSGLMNPNQYLSVVVWHLFQQRPAWPIKAGVGKTVVTSVMLDRVADSLQRPIVETPVGFKWFVPYLFEGRCGLGCEESAGASFLRFDGLPWSTDKDGPLLCLLAAEIMAKHGKTPAELYRRLTEHFGDPAYSRIDSPLAPEKRARFAGLDVSTVTAKTLAGDPITRVLTHAPANNAPIGGLKVMTDKGWFAARPSGTEAICKVYTESFGGEEHRKHIESEAVELLEKVLK